MTGPDEPAVVTGVRLGVDVGAVRVGVAASDPHLILATPVATVPRDTGAESDIATIVGEILARDAVGVFVGLPRTLAGEEGSSARMARDYAQRLADRLADQRGPDAPSVEVRLIDERLTTVSAHRSLHAAGLPMKKHRSRVDQVAAIGILQQALDGLRAGRHPGELVLPTTPAETPPDDGDRS
ncbi:Holliday junction resolvase RuvX [Tersicoccus sp. Bi-70]|uniref:Holliday junction resolvase RuvX n=1 Tax=Tersicoccus sp. Bi-70 TaxID=1897634 RepID=UPI000975DFA9|nr:Holliday junction resolvase RuvX [Tersicoccus sp. Bi-70]OMH37021.1 Holliday junction DNA helicase RuvA [Tersicoccus sp. Bi-70]